MAREDLRTFKLQKDGVWIIDGQQTKITFAINKEMKELVKKSAKGLDLSVGRWIREAISDRLHFKNGEE